MIRDLKTARDKAAADAEPKSRTHTRATFHLPKSVVADLTALAGETRAQAVRDGRRADNKSEIVEAALRAEITKRRKAIL